MSTHEALPGNLVGAPLREGLLGYTEGYSCTYAIGSSSTRRHRQSSSGTRRLKHLSIYPSIHLSIYPSIYPSIHPSIYRLIPLFIYLSNDLSNDLSTILSLCLFVSVYLLICLPICPSRNLSNPYVSLGAHREELRLVHAREHGRRKPSART